MYTRTDIDRNVLLLLSFLYLFKDHFVYDFDTKWIL